jgi:hypothetical protein
MLHLEGESGQALQVEIGPTISYSMLYGFTKADFQEERS